MKELQKLADEKGFKSRIVAFIPTGDDELKIITLGCWMYELQRWLRRIHSIHVEIYKVPVTGEDLMYRSFVCQWINNVEYKFIYLSFHENYGKALKAGLEESLNIIE